MYRYCDQLFIELSGRKGFATNVLGADISLPPSLPGDRYLKLGSKGDLRAEISGSIVRYEALAPRPEVLLLCYFVGTCAAPLELKFLTYSWRKYPHRVDKIQHAADANYWGEFLQQVDKRSCLRCRKQVGNTFIVVKTMY